MQTPVANAKATALRLIAAPPVRSRVNAITPTARQTTPMVTRSGAEPRAIG
jgi:hypothetical protein